MTRICRSRTRLVPQRRWDSLGAVYLAGRLQDDFGLDPPLELFFAPKSLHELAAEIAAAAHSSEDSLLAQLLDEAVRRRSATISVTGR